MEQTQLTAAEQTKIRKLSAKQWSGEDIAKKLQKSRSPALDMGPSRSAVQRFINGTTFKPSAPEQRGRKVAVTRQVLAIANKQRLRLIKEAKNQWTVTWGDIHKATIKVAKKKKLFPKGVPPVSQDALARRMRADTGVRSRPARARVARSEDEEKRRWAQAKAWSKYPATWWKNEIHAYIDNKTFVMARSVEEKRRLRQSFVRSHLRTKAEGADKGFVVPKKNRCLFGLKSLDITAAIAKDKVILWHVNEKPWNGERASEMYEALGKALRKTWGVKRMYRVVEDGDTKGFQSGKGKAAKRTEKIKSWQLPPRTPEWMPLDFAVWTEIEQRVLKKNVGAESLQSYQLRLRQTAAHLPKQFLSNTLGSIPKRIKATVKSRGAHIKED